MSNIFDQKLLAKLILLGFTEKEALVYTTLLRGETGAMGLSRATGLHRQFVYNALESLQIKGLVTRTEGARRKWRAQNPRKLIALAEERELVAQQAAEELIILRGERAGQEFEVIEGKNAFRSRVLATIRNVAPESTMFMICGEWGRYFERAGEAVHTEWDRIRVSKKIRFRVIGPESLKDSMNEAAATRELMEYRVFPGLEKNLVNTVIYPDNMVDFDIYGDPHVTFSIKSPEIAASQRHFFESLWALNSPKS